MQLTVKHIDDDFETASGTKEYAGFNYEINANSREASTASFKVLRALGVSNRDIQRAIAEEREMWKRIKEGISHRKLPDGRIVLRGSEEEAAEYLK